MAREPKLPRTTRQHSPIVKNPGAESFGHARERSIGFLWQPPEQASRAVGENEVLLRFDSGRVITHKDGACHTFVGGATGSGKTESVVLPAVNHHLAAANRMLVTDEKGNLGDSLRALARIHNREGEIAEYGCSPLARKINLVSGMSGDSLRRFLEDLIMHTLHGQTENIAWYLKGVYDTVRLYKLLLYMSEKFGPQFLPDLVMLQGLLEDHEAARRIYAVFKKAIFNPADRRHKKLVASIDSNKFSILWRKKFEKSSDFDDGGSDYDNQITWNLQGIRMALQDFIEAPGVAAHFAMPGGPPLDIMADVQSGAIVLPRFALDTGPIGAMLTRVIIDDYYKAILSLGVDAASRQPTFICMDEFQETARLSGKRYSDNSFIGLARAFGVEMMAISQSVSSLVCRGTTPGALESFLANCNQKIFFYSDDPDTQAIVNRHASDILLSALKPCNCFVCSYNADDKSHEYGRETLNEEYAAVRKLLAEAPEAAPWPEDSSVQWMDVEDLACLAEEKAEIGARKKVEAERKDRHFHMTNPCGMEKASAEESGRQEQAAAAPTEGTADGMGANPHDDYAEKIRQAFTAIFEEEAEIEVPLGWRDYFEDSLKLFTASGLPGKIKRVGIGSDGQLQVWSSRHSSYGSHILNRILRPTGSMCLLCGKRLEKPAPESATRQRDMEHVLDYPDEPVVQDPYEIMPVCPNCLARFGLENSGR